MKCRKIQLLLSDHVDGSLSPRTSSAVRQHLAHCTACHAEWQALRATLRWTEYYGQQHCPVDLADRVLATLPHSTASSRRRLPPIAWAMPMVAVLLVVFTFHLHFPIPSTSSAEYPSGNSSGYHAEVGGATKAVVGAADFEPEISAPVHDQYHYTTSLGASDGLLLSLSLNMP